VIRDPALRDLARRLSRVRMFAACGMRWDAPDYALELPS
jgi:hypothetical protein